MTDDAATTAVTQVPGQVWVWEWNRETGALEKVRIPSNLLPADWIEPLQRRYAVGDRVVYTIHDDQQPQPGTVVKDQGMYVAIDGDAPGASATAHKTHVQPLVDADATQSTPTAKTTPPATIVGSPHAEPTLRTDERRITARWDVGETSNGWQQQAHLEVHYVKETGYRATLRTMFVRCTAHETREVASTEPATVMYGTEAKRFSAKGLRTSYRTALEDVRQQFDRDDPDVVAYFQASVDFPAE